jgi:hypothetical protein
MDQLQSMPQMGGYEPRKNSKSEKGDEFENVKSPDDKRNKRKKRINLAVGGGAILIIIIGTLYLFGPFFGGWWIWGHDDDDQDPEYKGMSGLKLPTREKLDRLPQDQQPIEKSEKHGMFPLRLADSTVQLYYPPAGQQGKQGSCTAFSVGYALVSYYEKRRAGYSYDTGFDGLPSDTKVFSPAFVFNALCSGNCEEGIEFIDAFDLIRDNGICKWVDFKYDGTKLKCTPSPDNKVYAKASPFSGYRFFRARRSFDKFMEYLDAGIPLIIGIYTSETMFKDGFSSEKKTPYFWNPSENDMLDYHAILCVGYDKAKESFILLNSWGPKWGDNGYCYIKKNVFMDRYREVYIARLNRAMPVSKEFRINSDTSFVTILITKPLLLYDSTAALTDNSQLDSLFKTDYQRVKSLDTTNVYRKSLLKKLEKYISVD